jgi:NADH-quinone oxidoreductase subunit F
MNARETPLTKNIRNQGDAADLEAYQASGGYQAAVKALRMTPEAITEIVKQSSLRGRGGAGFPTGTKWSFVPMGDGAPHPKYLVCNADEMEPGTFKDRLLLERSPHQLIEGMIIAAHAIEANITYIFLRGEYTLSARQLEKAIHEAYSKHFLGKNIFGSGQNLEMYLHLSAGRYMCGEETGLLNALEGKRANPRAKPPYPQVSGLWGKPTILQNVETLCNLPHIIANGADWFKKLSRTKNGGTKLYGVSGRVKRPGLWELPMGTTIREILEEHAGGMRDGVRFRGVLPGGASTDFLTEEHLDVSMDFDEVQKVGSRLGTGTMIILDDQTCPVGMCWNLEHFFAQESCGWCTPCWSGLRFAARILQVMEEGQGKSTDLEKLEYLSWFCAPGNTFCALAPGAVEPLQSALRLFRGDFERHIREQRCPWRS